MSNTVNTRGPDKGQRTRRSGYSRKESINESSVPNWLAKLPRAEQRVYYNYKQLRRLRDKGIQISAITTNHFTKDEIPFDTMVRVLATISDSSLKKHSPSRRLQVDKWIAENPYLFRPYLR